VEGEGGALPDLHVSRVVKADAGHGSLADGETESQALLRELVEELGDGVKGKMGPALAVGKDGPVEVSSYFVEIEGDIKPNPSVSLRALKYLCCTRNSANTHAAHLCS